MEDWIGQARGFLARTEDQEHARRRPAPAAAVIAASDFPVAPATLFGRPATDIYDIRTVAGIVPPSAGENADRSVGAALEFAVRVYGVCQIIVLAHPQCGLVRCLIEQEGPGAEAVLQGRFLPSWAGIAASSLSRVLHAKIPEDERAALCCQEIVRVSFENLMTYPWILDAVFDGRLGLHGLYVDPVGAVLHRFDAESDSFIDS